MPEHAGGDGPAAYTAPVAGLVHTAVADRPLEEVIQLITLLEQSPEYERATVDALRAVGLDRSVEDVTRLVAMLTRPPRSPDSADETIRAAAECRPIEDVTQLMALLHKAQLEPHCAQEAVRAAATSRPVEDLVQLIGRMSYDEDLRRQLLQSATGRPADVPQASQPAHAGGGAPGGEARRGTGDRAERDRRPARRARDGRGERAAGAKAAPAWPRWIASVLLVLCGAAHFPLHRDGASLSAYGFAVGVSVLCVLLAADLFVRGTLPVLVVSLLVPTALVAARLAHDRIGSPGLAKALGIGLAPGWAAGLAAALAVVAVLVALLGLVSLERFGRRPGPRPLVADQPAD